MGWVKAVFYFVVTCFVWLPLANAKSGSFDFSQAEVKLWLWPFASQVQVTDPLARTTFLLYFEYNLDRSQIVDFELIPEGLYKDQFRSLESVDDLRDLLRQIIVEGKIHVMIEEPRVYRPAPDGEPIPGVAIRHSSGKKIRPMFEKHLSARAQREWINSELTQEQLDFELFRQQADLLLAKQSDQPFVAFIGGIRCSQVFAGF